MYILVVVVAVVDDVNNDHLNFSLSKLMLFIFVIQQNGLNALHLASKEGHTHIVTELLRRGANVNTTTNVSEFNLLNGALFLLTQLIVRSKRSIDFAARTHISSNFFILFLVKIDDQKIQ